ncbi:hypothetical protein EDI_271070 [Entamoeba dispar SAW760]|uniref:Transmembrane protein n=1 Tax=Entamoeba dispar (strain ATCC PRA-260 / SAW760) TaxID=370354 RepID=B0EJY2_ENTDS|nr:uncharacterized protein EDI_271070 [Entamoeba dispar SAW760]EDR25168.1 hypothetical protein EDI_271070 [Entamoeba dispar SAW760]|eukprot:EDR25168.1 hypothetical protein EDI_271070 [Entamoeba dispar SAW760]
MYYSFFIQSMYLSLLQSFSNKIIFYPIDTCPFLTQFTFIKVVVFSSVQVVFGLLSPFLQCFLSSLLLLIISFRHHLHPFYFLFPSSSHTDLSGVLYPSNDVKLSLTLLFHSDEILNVSKLHTISKKLIKWIFLILFFIQWISFLLCYIIANYIVFYGIAFLYFLLVILSFYLSFSSSLRPQPNPSPLYDVLNQLLPVLTQTKCEFTQITIYITSQYYSFEYIQPFLQSSQLANNYILVFDQIGDEILLLGSTTKHHTNDQLNNTIEDAADAEGITLTKCSGSSPSSMLLSRSFKTSVITSRNNYSLMKKDETKIKHIVKLISRMVVQVDRIGIE